MVRTRSLGGRNMLWIVPLIYLLLKIIVNPQPLVSLGGGKVTFGFFNFTDDRPVAADNYDFAICPVMQISPYETNLDIRNPMPPLSRDGRGVFHVLGTDHLGRDVLACFVSGLELALLIALLVSLGTGLVSMIMGVQGAYCARFPLMVSAVEAGVWIFVLIFIALSLGWFLMGALDIISLLGVILCAVLILPGIRYVSKNKKRRYRLPVNALNRQAQEFFQPIPDLILLLVLITVFDQISLWGLIIILLLLRLPAGSWYLQGQATQFIHQKHIDQARTMGFSGMRIVFRHMIPLMAPSVRVFMGLTASRAVLSESALAFLGIGPTGGMMSWGSMIRLGLSDLNMWWVSLFPVLGLVAVAMLFMYGSRVDK